MDIDPRRVAARYLTAALVKLPPKARKQLNTVLIQAGMDGNGRFKSPNEALTEAGKILNSAGLEWDEVINSYPLRHAPKGNMNVTLAITNKDDPFSPVSIQNSMLAFQWYQLDGGMYEVVAYLS